MGDVGDMEGRGRDAYFDNSGPVNLRIRKAEELTWLPKPTPSPMMMRPTMSILI